MPALQPLPVIRPTVWIGWWRATQNSDWTAVSREHTQLDAFRAALENTLAGDVCALPPGRLPIARPKLSRARRC
jgi:hypothetical protein